MAVLFSNEFNVAEEQLKALGVFNTFLDEDSHFFINIKRLQVTTVPEFATGYARVNQYFHNIGTLLKASRSDKDRTYKEAFRRFNFSEVNGINLGFSSGTHGAGFGSMLRAQIIKDAKAESTDKKVYILVNTGQGESRIKTVMEKHEEMLSAGMNPAKIVIIDARTKNAASTHQ